LYHPYARDVLASASYDRSIKLWNVDTQEAMITLKGFTDVIFNMSFSPCGTRLAAICKDGFIRIYEPLTSDMPVIEAQCGPVSGSKAARIDWVLNGSSLLVSGFGKGNLRQIYLLDAETLNLLQTEDINSSPSLLIPIYDEDINVLYLYAKGEENVYLFEIQEEEPYFQVLTPFKTEGLHFAMSILPKVHCDVKLAEIAKCYRLTKDNRIEKISFTVPRVKLGFFQDDIFPMTLDRSEPYLTARQWFSGGEANSFEFNYLNLKPKDMDNLTEILAVEKAQPPKPSKARQLNDLNSNKNGMDLYNPDNLNADEQKIINSMLHRATLFYKEKSDDENEDNSEWN
jgi:coronin-7